MLRGRHAHPPLTVTVIATATLTVPATVPMTMTKIVVMTVTVIATMTGTVYGALGAIGSDCGRGRGRGSESHVRGRTRSGPLLLGRPSADRGGDRQVRGDEI